MKANEMTLEEKFERAMDLLHYFTDFAEGVANEPTEPHRKIRDEIAAKYREYMILTGRHMVLTEEGWVPAELNTREKIGDEPMEVLDEVNKPIAA